jgi:hypothetical protein
MGAKLKSAKIVYKITEFNEVYIAFLVDQMKPGWSALLAAYPAKLVKKANDSFEKLGAVILWNVPESMIAEVVRRNQMKTLKQTLV